MQKKSPPRWADQLLMVFLPEDLAEELQGDMHEQFDVQVEEMGLLKARWLYLWEVLRFCRPYFLRRRLMRKTDDYHPISIFSLIMISNYFKIAWRNLLRNKAFSFINILGLALGMVCSLFIFLWIQDELSVDTYHKNGAVLYRVMERQYFDGKIEATESTPGLLADELKKEFPEITYASSLLWSEKMTFTVGDKTNKESGRWAGADWFKMFSVPILAGNTQTALNGPNNLAISKKMAINYFGSVQAAIGKSMKVDAEKDYQVTAVFDDLPANASQKYDFLFSWFDSLGRREWLRSWDNNDPATYIMVRPDANVANLEAKMRFMLRKLNKDMDIKEYDVQLFLQAYNDTYLYSKFENGEQAGGRIEYVRLFGIVAVFLLLIACINFMNLSTARSAKRAREVGVRKAIGAAKASLIVQFVGETMLLTFLALVSALVIVVLLLPAFNTLTGKHINLNFTQPSLLLIMLGMMLTTGIVAGSYPAIFLSSLNPVRVLKGALKFSAGAKLFRQGLVVFQFTLSMLLIVGTIVVYRQINYIQTKNLGYDRENLIYVPIDGELGNKYETFKERLLQMPGIQQVSFMGNVPMQLNGNTGGVTWPGKDPNANIRFGATYVGYDFIRTLKVGIKGRDFAKEFGTDSSNYIINQAAVKRIGYKDPVGQPITLWGKPGKIIGVMNDFHFQSLHEAIQPLILRLRTGAARGSISIRTQPSQTTQALASIESLTKELNPNFPFSYTFADSAYTAIYRSEMMIGTLSNYFAFLAIFISCLGLFGLSAFTAEQRTKEIGVRKVLGASVASVIGLLSKDFLKLVCVAILIASPLAWYAMNEWLKNFNYKIDIEWWVFALAGITALLIALLTISFQTIKAALVNPVKSLKSE